MKVADNRRLNDICAVSIGRLGLKRGNVVR